MSEETKKKIGETLKKISTENKNRTGTCPEQLLDRLQGAINKNKGLVPHSEDLPSYEAICRTYGSMKNALDILGYKSRKAGENIHKGFRKKFEKEELITMLKDFKKREGRRPSQSDIRRAFLPSDETFRRRFGSWNNALREAKLI